MIRELRSPDENCFVQLFYRNLNGAIDYICPLNTCWSHLYGAIEDALIKSSHGCFGVQVGIAQGGAMVMVPALNFFALINSWKKGTNVMIMAVNSSITCNYFLHEYDCWYLLSHVLFR